MSCVLPSRWLSKWASSAHMQYTAQTAAIAISWGRLSQTGGHRYPNPQMIDETLAQGAVSRTHPQQRAKVQSDDDRVEDDAEFEDKECRELLLKLDARELRVCSNVFVDSAILFDQAAFHWHIRSPYNRRDELLDVRIVGKAISHLHISFRC